MKKIVLAKIYIVVSEEENKFFPTFGEAEIYAKDICDEKDEEIEIFEVVKAWTVSYPTEPQPEASEMNLDELVE